MLYTLVERSLLVRSSRNRYILFVDDPATNRTISGCILVLDSSARRWLMNSMTIEMIKMMHRFSVIQVTALLDITIAW